MKNRIIAEFDTVDSAEWAARWIKENGSHINSIQISNANPRFKNDFSETIASFPNFAGATASVGLAFVNEVPDPSYSKDAIPHYRTILRVTVDDSPDNIKHMMTSLGGTNIRSDLV